MKNKKIIQAGSVASLTLLAALATTTEAKANEVTPSPASTTPAQTTESKPNPTASTTPSETTTKDVVILHTNDIHGRLEEERGRDKNTSVIGVAKLDTVYKNETAKSSQSTYLLDAGDAFQGLPISNASKGEDMANIMNKIGYDAMAVGNHEFDFTLETAKKYKELLKFPILSSNTYVNDARLFEAHTILDKDTSIIGDELVVIGVTTPETSTKTHPRNVEGVTFKDPITEVENVIKELSSKVNHKNYVILAHLGNDISTEEKWRGSTLAKALSTNPLLKDKNVIVIDGHSHTVENATFGNVSYTQTGSYLNNIGKISFKAGDSKSTISLIPAKDTTNLVPNAEITELVKKAKENFEKINSEVVIENNPVELSSARENVRVRETNLGNLISDSLYAYGNKGGFEKPTDLAVFNGGGIRADIKKDTKVTKADIIKVLPFGNSVAQIEVSGAQIKEMFTRSLGSATQKDKTTGATINDENGQPLLEALGGFLHVSGTKVYYDTKLEKYARILKIEILNRETGKYEALDNNKKYNLVTNDFLAAGGDGYKMLGGARLEGPSVDVALADFIKTVNLTDYEIINPNSRIISISSEEFTRLANAVKEVPTVAPTVDAKPELILPTPSVRVELPKELSPVASDLQNLLSKKPEVRLENNRSSQITSVEEKSTKSSSTNNSVKTLPKTSSTSKSTNPSLPAGLAAALLAAGLLTANRRRED